MRGLVVGAIVLLLLGALAFSNTPKSDSMIPRTTEVLCKLTKDGAIITLKPGTYLEDIKISDVCGAEKIEKGWKLTCFSNEGDEFIVSFKEEGKERTTKVVCT